MIVAAAALLLGETFYRWRRLPVGGAPVLAVALPNKGRRAFVANGAGFEVCDLVRPDRIPMAAVTGVALGDFAPDTVVAVGKADEGGNLRFSIDAGESWRPCPTAPALEGGSIAVSSTGRTWVWSTPAGTKRTEDYGFSWADCVDLPVGSPIVADRTSARQFYAVAEGKLYVSTDGAKGFEPLDLALAGEDEPQRVVSTPGRAGDLWLLAGGHLYRSLPGQAFRRVPGVTDPTALSFGLARGSSTPGPFRLAVFFAGQVEGRSGLFRSDDDGTNWSRLNSAPENVLTLAGDPAHIGRVFAAPQTGGVWVGDPR